MNVSRNPCPTWVHTDAGFRVSSQKNGHVVQGCQANRVNVGAKLVTGVVAIDTWRCRRNNCTGHDPFNAFCRQNRISTDNISLSAFYIC